METKHINIYILALLLLIGFSAKAGNNNASTEHVGVRFTDWKFSDLSYQAKVRYKPMFVFIGSKTCLQSKKMEDVFHFSKVSDEVNDNYISNKYDVTGVKNRMKAMSSWNVYSFPTMLFFAPDGKLIHMASGYHNYDKFLALLAEVQTKMETYEQTKPESKRKSIYKISDAKQGARTISAADAIEMRKAKAETVNNAVKGEAVKNDTELSAAVKP